ncbi:MAG: hypothetical protein FWH03_00755 [Firmicutes bacterium]|nr:hypothetical protein [Bacillota bacterium]
MKQVFYRQVGFTIFRNEDNTAFIDVPLYVKVTELNENGLTPSEQRMISRVSEVILKDNDQKIKDKIISLKKGVNENGNDKCV